MATSIDAEEPTRRDFLLIATGAAAVVGAASAVWPFVSQMLPDRSTIAAGVPIEVDLTPIPEGQTITVKWRGKPIFVRHRTAAEIKSAQDVDIKTLPDPATDADRVMHMDGKPVEPWLVVIGICTHLGCIPTKNAGDYGGWFCPCHGSQYDTAGRIRKGPAPLNLVLAPASFLTPTKIRIG